MSSLDINGTTVYVSAIESVADGVSYEYDRLWDAYVGQRMIIGMSSRSIHPEDAVRDEEGKLVAPCRADHPAVIVKLTSGREFRIVGKTRKEVELEIFWAKRRDRS